MLRDGYPADLHVSLDGRTDLTGQIYRQLREAVLDGRLLRGELLPPSRELARRLTVSRNTVTAAYDRLTAEGFVSGSSLPAVARPAVPGAAGQRRRRRRLRRPGRPPRAAHRDRPARRAVPRRPHHPRRRLRDERHAAGHVPARRVLLEPGSTVAVEDPGYPPPHQVLRSLDARLVGVPVDAEGLVVDAIPPAARMVYVTPSHQYPLGMPMSLSRRMALLAWADQCGGVIIEDDYDSEFRFGGRPIEPLQSLDRSGRVCYVGSFSKVMLPTLRLGFLIAPPALHSALRKAKFVTDWHTELPGQAALARFIGDGGLSAHIRRMRHVYRERHELIAAALSDELPPWLTPIQSAAGLHVSALSAGPTDAELWQVTDSLTADGVAVLPLSPFAVGAHQRVGLLIGYGMISSADIRPGLSLLRDALRRA